MISNSLTQESELYPVTNGYINHLGKRVLNLPEKTCCPRSFFEGLAAVRFVPSDAYDVRLGYIDQTGEFVIPPKFFDSSGLQGSENFSEGLAAATFLEVDDEQGDSLYGYINTVGEMVIAPQFYEAHPFSDGIAVVEFYSQEGTRVALINQQGEIIFEHPQSHEAYDSSEGLAAVCIHELWGFVDATTGQFVIEPQFPKVGRFSHGLAPAIQHGSRRLGQYREQYGYIDRTGQFVIQPQFINAEPFSEGLAPVNVGGNEYGYGGEWGYIDPTGHFVIPPQFEDMFGTMSGFSEGLAAVTVADSRFGYNGKKGYIDRTGHFVIPPQFNSGASSFYQGLAYVGLMFEKEIQGTQISSPTSSDFPERQLMEMEHSGEFPYGGGKSGYINQQGNFVWEEQHSY